MTRRTVYPHGSHTRGSRDFISVGQGARRHHLIQCDPPNHAWQGPGCATVGDHGFPMTSVTCVSETVQVWSLLVEEVRADTGRRYRRLWHQRALARAPETLLVRRMTKGFHPRSRSFRRQRTCYTRRCLPGASCAPLHTVATPTVALQFPHGSLETSAGTIKSHIVFLLTIIIQFIGEANFYVVYVDTTSSSAD